VKVYGGAASAAAADCEKAANGKENAADTAEASSSLRMKETP
jgi:hypothetical protein